MFDWTWPGVQPLKRSEGSEDVGADGEALAQSNGCEATVEGGEGYGVERRWRG